MSALGSIGLTSDAYGAAARRSSVKGISTGIAYRSTARKGVTFMKAIAGAFFIVLAANSTARAESVSTAEQKPAIGRRKTRPLALLRAGNVGRA